MNVLLIAVPLLPLLAAAAVLTIGHRMSGGGGNLVVGAIGLSLAALIPLRGGASIGALWFASGSLGFTVGLETTGLTWFTAMIVAAIAFGVGLYSLGYFIGEGDQSRFFAGLGLFCGRHARPGPG